MVAIRHYDRYAAIPVAPATVPPVTPTNMPNGQMCVYGKGREGTSHYAVCSSRGVEVMEVDFGSAAKTVNLVSYTGGATGDGLPKGIDSTWKGKVIIVVEIEEGAPPVLKMKLRQLDEDTGTLDWEVDMGDCGSAGPIVYNGIDWWLSYTSTVTAPNSARLLQLSIDGNNVTVINNFSHNTFSGANTQFTDMAYDGHWVWALTGVYLSRWEMNQRLNPRNAWGGAGGFPVLGANPQGIATGRGMHNTILSRT